MATNPSDTAASQPSSPTIQLSLSPSALVLPETIHEDPTHKRQEVQPLPPSERPQPPQPSQNLDDDTPVPSPNKIISPGQDPSLLWRPSYLRGTVLASFIFIFGLLIIAVELLLFYADQNDGIATAFTSQHYLWTYGPTAILTLMAAIWNRVSYQCKLIAPWVRLSQQQSNGAQAKSSQTLLLDYVSGFEPWVIFKSLANGDWVVLLSSMVSLLIKILIVVSTGLITLSLIEVTHNSYPMVIQDRFIDGHSLTTEPGTLTEFIMLATRIYGDNSVGLPDGLSPGYTYAFQSVQRNAPESAETRITVDGLESSLDCSIADVVLATDSRQVKYYQFDHLPTPNFTAITLDCSINALKIDQPYVVYFPSNNTSHTVLYTRMAAAECDAPIITTSTTEGRRRLAILAANITYTGSRTIDNDNRPEIWENRDMILLELTIQSSALLLCVPGYSIDRVEIIRNGTQTPTINMASAHDSTRPSDPLTAWKLADAHWSSYLYTRTVDDSNLMFNDTTGAPAYYLDSDAYMRAALASHLPQNMTEEAFLDDIFTSSFLTRTAGNYYRQFTTLLAKQMLMEPVSLNATGTCILKEDRLVVRTWSAQWMAGLMAGCIILVLGVLALIPTQGILPHNPAQPLGVATIVSHSRDLLMRVKSLGGADNKNLIRVLPENGYRSKVIFDHPSVKSRFTIEMGITPGSQPHPQILSRPFLPIILHSASRLSLCALLVALIITLELLLRKSTNEEGLGDVGDDTFIHYTWTAIPSLVLGLLALAFSAADFQTRLMAPYISLKNGITAEVFPNLDLLDMSFPRVILREIRLASIAALAGTAALVISSFFTILSSSLFQEISIPTTDLIALHSTSSFDLSGYNENVDTAALNASIILGSNFKYPRFTHVDLAFPALEPIMKPAGGNINGSSIDTVIPALRGRLDNCRAYPMAKIKAENYGHGVSFDEFGYLQNPISLKIEDEGCGMSIPMGGNYFLPGPGDASYDYFGYSQDPFPLKGCSDFLYIWGKVDLTANPQVQHVSAMGCNMTLEMVQVDTTFTNLKLDIDTDNPPRPREDTAQPAQDYTSLTMSTKLVYRSIAERGVANHVSLDPFFSLLAATPPFAIENLGNASTDGGIMDAIRRQHGIIVAQYLLTTLIPADETNATTTGHAEYRNDAQPTYPANIANPFGRRWVVQDETSTRVLEVLLGVTLLLLVLNWAFMRDTGGLAASPTTIAAVAALVSGGNLIDSLPVDAQWLTEEEIISVYPPGTKFRLGWGRVKDEDGLDGNGVSSFGIYGVLDGEDGEMGGESWEGDGGNGGSRERDEESGLEHGDGSVPETIDDMIITSIHGGGEREMEDEA